MSTPSTSNWTEERLDLMVKLWKQGHSGTAIARELGVTRNAIFGKVARLGLPRHKQAQLEPPPKPLGNNNSIPLPKPKQLKTPTRPSSTLLKVSAGECRFPMWPSEGTGAPDWPVCGDCCSILEPYCAAHSAIAFSNTKSPVRYNPPAFDFSVRPIPGAVRKDVA